MKKIVAYDKAIMHIMQSTPDNESDATFRLFTEALQELDGCSYCIIENVEGFYRITARTDFGTKHSSFYEKHNLLYLILVFSNILTDQEKWSTVVKAHKETAITDGAIGVVFRVFDIFFALVEEERLESDKIKEL